MFVVEPKEARNVSAMSTGNPDDDQASENIPEKSENDKAYDGSDIQHLKGVEGIYNKHVYACKLFSFICEYAFFILYRFPYRKDNW